MLLCLCAALLTGCGTADGRQPFAPGIDAEARGADPLEVGHRMLAAGEAELAHRAFLRAAARHGPTAEVLAALGSANLELRRLGQAEQLLRRATEADPRYVEAWNNLGVVLLEQGRPGEAVPAFERAAELDSGRTAAIEDNLELALSQLRSPDYDLEPKAGPRVIRRGADGGLRRLPDPPTGKVAR